MYISFDINVEHWHSLACVYYAAVICVRMHRYKKTTVLLICQTLCNFTFISLQPLYIIHISLTPTVMFRMNFPISFLQLSIFICEHFVLFNFICLKPPLSFIIVCTLWGCNVCVHVLSEFLNTCFNCTFICWICTFVFYLH